MLLLAHMRENIQCLILGEWCVRRNAHQKKCASTKQRGRERERERRSMWRALDRSGADQAGEGMQLARINIHVHTLVTHESWQVITRNCVR